MSENKSRCQSSSSAWLSFLRTKMDFRLYPHPMKMDELPVHSTGVLLLRILLRTGI